MNALQDVHHTHPSPPKSGQVHMTIAPDMRGQREDSAVTALSFASRMALEAHSGEKMEKCPAISLKTCGFFAPLGLSQRLASGRSPCYARRVPLRETVPVRQRLKPTRCERVF
jgi:hypothetical protein